ncbi:hypothetical protein PG996_002535 [Apiospora saccharicola]|uniref:Uncharacterized protein n=1 Tax=Apiospora saccharicola TaxID=335842 RepID=A0ABR1WJQ8_9PEZI
MAEQKRYIDTLRLSKGSGWITNKPVTKVLGDFWNIKNNPEARQTEVVERWRWRELKDGDTKLENVNKYLLLHDYIAQAIGAGALDDVANPTAVFRVLFEEGRDKNDPKRRAAFTAAARYLYHAKRPLDAATIGAGRAGPGLHFGPDVLEGFVTDFGGNPYCVFRFGGWITSFVQVTTAEEAQRLAKTVNYFIGMKRVKNTAVEKALDKLWRNAGFIEEYDGESSSDEDIFWNAAILERKKWKDLLDPTEEDCRSYVRLHDYIAQLVGQGLVKSLTCPFSVLLVAWKRPRPEGEGEGDPIRDAALKAATKYLDHADKELVSIANEYHQIPVKQLQRLLDNLGL